VFLLESSPRPIAFQACECRTHETPDQEFCGLKKVRVHTPASIAIRHMAKAATILEFIQGLRGTLSLYLRGRDIGARLHDLLKPHVSRLVVCDPRKAALLKQGNKSDRIDARSWRNSCAPTSSRRSITENKESVERAGPRERA
jgi:hypothetical protein